MSLLDEEAVEIIDFKPLRREMEDKVRKLQAARQTEEVQRATSTLTRFMADLCDDSNPNYAICGPHMVDPLVPR